MDASLFKDRDIFQKCLENIQKEVSRSKEDFLQEHFSKYNDPSLPPVWKTMEVVSFGMLSKLYCNFSDVDVKKAVAHSFGLPQYLYLETWTKCIAVLRNLCAHHDRIWNKRFPWKPQLPKRLPLAWIDTRSLRPIKLYAQLCCLAYLEQSIHPKSDFSHRIALRQVPNDYKSYGLPCKLARRTTVESIAPSRLFHLTVGAGSARPKTSTALFVDVFGQANPAPTSIKQKRTSILPF